MTPPDSAGSEAESSQNSSRSNLSDDDEEDTAQAESPENSSHSNLSEDEEEDTGSHSNGGSDINEDHDKTDIQPDDNASEPIHSFSELALDPRLERAVEKLAWNEPTPVQASVIPTMMRGRDILVQAPTGTGKTAAYAIPLVQNICLRNAAAANKSSSTLSAVVLVPTRELVHQVHAVIKSLCRFVEGVHVSALPSAKTAQSGDNNKRRKKATGAAASAAKGVSAARRNADIVVATPASVKSLQNVNNANLLNTVQAVVVDEADLVLSYGYERDARSVLSSMPESAQTVLLSATLDTDEMEQFHKAVLKKPISVRLSAIEPNGSDTLNGATHYQARLPNRIDRFLVMYAMLRLDVLCGKVLIFVNHINTAFKLKLFLDQFKIKSAVLNAELPANSRIHCVQQYNAGIFDILIAADEAPDADAKGQKKGKGVKRRRRLDHDEEFGLSRGVDFKDVAAVLNFDVPHSVDSYTHRAGRTARGGKSGTVLSLSCSDDDEQRLGDIGEKVGVHIGPLAFRMEQVESFRYRVEDCLRLVTDVAVRGARLADVKREMVNSEQLKGYFEEKPEDLEALEHSTRLSKRVSEHLGNIPSYLMPTGLQSGPGRSGGERGAVNRGSGGNRKGGGRSGGGGGGKRDALKTFSMSGSSRGRFREKHGIKKRKSKSTNGSAPVRKRRRL